MAEYLTQEREQGRDTVGLVAGLIFVAVGLGYLIGGNSVLSDHRGVALPVALVLLGVAGLAGAGVVRVPRRAAPAPTPVPDQPLDP